MVNVSLSSEEHRNCRSRLGRSNNTANPVHGFRVFYPTPQKSWMTSRLFGPCTPRNSIMVRLRCFSLPDIRFLDGHRWAPGYRMESAAKTKICRRLLSYLPEVRIQTAVLLFGRAVIALRSIRE